MATPHSSISASNSPFQTQLPHICTPPPALAIPGKWDGWEKNGNGALPQSTSGSESGTANHQR